MGGVEFGIGLIDDILRLRLTGRVDEFVTMVSGLDPVLVQQHVARHPGAAFVATYALLRSSNRGRAMQAVRMLEAECPGWPDTLVLASELAALEGRHVDAVAGFIAVRRTGLPLFSYGLAYTIDRLRLYVQSGVSSKASAVDEALEAARDALAWAQRVGMVTDFEQSLLMFNGLDPENPGDAPLGAADLRAAAGAVVLFAGYQPG